MEVKSDHNNDLASLNIKRVNLYNDGEMNNTLDSVINELTDISTKRKNSVNSPRILLTSNVYSKKYLELEFVFDSSKIDNNYANVFLDTLITRLKYI